MARFYGTVSGRAQTEASRLGTPNSGLQTSACSWQGRVECSLWAKDDVDMISIRAESHGSSDNPTGPIFTGTFEELGQLIDWWQNRDQINAVIALLGTDKLARLTGKAVK